MADGLHSRDSRLAELIGPAAGRLHTARSRNDQVVTDFRLWVRSACERADQGLLVLQRALVAQAEKHVETIMRRDVNQRVKERIYQVAFVCILAFFAFVIFNDLTRLNLFTKLKP